VQVAERASNASISASAALRSDMPSVRKASRSPGWSGTDQLLAPPAEHRKEGVVDAADPEALLQVGLDTPTGLGWLVRSRQRSPEGR